MIGLEDGDILLLKLLNMCVLMKLIYYMIEWGRNSDKEDFFSLRWLYVKK